MTDDELEDDFTGIDLAALRRFLRVSVPAVDPGAKRASLLSGRRADLLAMLQGQLRHAEVRPG